VFSSIRISLDSDSNAKNSKDEEKEGSPCQSSRQMTLTEPGITNNLMTVTQSETENDETSKK
jgi:hypothetical protein